jgi:hypothetical protein
MISGNDMYKFYTTRIEASFIIANKNVNVPFLEKCSDLKRYNEYISLNAADYQDKLLTKEEFDLLKEFLGIHRKMTEEYLEKLLKAKYRMFKGCRSFQREYHYVYKGKGE